MSVVTVRFKEGTALWTKGVFRKIQYNSRRNKKLVVFKRVSPPLITRKFESFRIAFFNSKDDASKT